MPPLFKEAMCTLWTHCPRYVLGHLSGQWQKEPSAKHLSAWQKRDWFLLQVVMHYPQYYYTVIKNPETAAEMEPYCTSCFPKHKPREITLWRLYISNCILVFAKNPIKQTNKKKPPKQQQQNEKKNPQPNNKKPKLKTTHIKPQSKRGSSYIWK